VVSRHPGCCGKRLVWPGAGKGLSRNRILASGKFEGNGRRTDSWGSSRAGFQHAFSSDIQKLAARVDVQSVWTPQPRWQAVVRCVGKAVLAKLPLSITPAGVFAAVAQCI
jgi:hypothetical protein